VKFIVDADVLSESTKPEPRQRVLNWLEQNEADLLLTPIVLGELEYGILSLPSGKRRTRLLKWFEGGVRGLNVIDIDADTAMVWAKLLAALKRKGKAMPIKDSLIAASALQHGLAVATRNTRDYRHSGVKVVNPFDE